MAYWSLPRVHRNKAIALHDVYTWWRVMTHDVYTWWRVMRHDVYTVVKTNRNGPEHSSRKWLIAGTVYLQGRNAKMSKSDKSVSLGRKLKFWYEMKQNFPCKVFNRYCTKRSHRFINQLHKPPGPEFFYTQSTLTVSIYLTCCPAFSPSCSRVGEPPFS